MVTYDCVIPIKTILAPKGKGFGTNDQSHGIGIQAKEIQHRTQVQIL